MGKMGPVFRSGHKMTDGQKRGFSFILAGGPTTRCQRSERTPRHLVTSISTQGGRGPWRSCWDLGTRLQVPSPDEAGVSTEGGQWEAGKGPQSGGLNKQSSVEWLLPWGLPWRACGPSPLNQKFLTCQILGNNAHPSAPKSLELTGTDPGLDPWGGPLSLQGWSSGLKAFFPPLCFF